MESLVDIYQNCQTNSLTQNITNEINVLESRIEGYKLQLLSLQKEYYVWSQKKAEVARLWADDLADIKNKRGEPIEHVAKELVEGLRKINCSEGGIHWVYKNLPKEYKRDYTQSKA